MQNEQKFGRDFQSFGAANNFSSKGKGYYKLFRFRNFDTEEIIMTCYDTERQAMDAYRMKSAPKILTHGFEVKSFHTKTYEDRAMLLSYI